MFANDGQPVTSLQQSISMWYQNLIAPLYAGDQAVFRPGDLMKRLCIRKTAWAYRFFHDLYTSNGSKSNLLHLLLHCNATGERTLICTDDVRATDPSDQLGGSVMVHYR